MKKILVFALLAMLTVQFGFSQTFVGGDFSLQRSTNEFDNTSITGETIAVSPSIGYRVGKTGAGVSFLFQSDTMSDYELTDIGIGIFADYNVLSIDKFSFLGRASLQYISSEIIWDDTIYISVPSYEIHNTEEQKLKTIGISISPIFEYRLLENLSLYTSIGNISFTHSYGKNSVNNTHSQINYSQDTSAKNFGLSVSTGVSLGFCLFL